VRKVRGGGLVWGVWGAEPWWAGGHFEEESVG